MRACVWPNELANGLREVLEGERLDSSTTCYQLDPEFAYRVLLTRLQDMRLAVQDVHLGNDFVVKRLLPKGERFPLERHVVADAQHTEGRVRGVALEHGRSGGVGIYDRPVFLRHPEIPLQPLPDASVVANPAVTTSTTAAGSNCKSTGSAPGAVSPAATLS